MPSRVSVATRIVRGAIRHPKRLALLALQLDAANGMAVGNLLHRALPSEERLAAASRLVAPEQLTFTFERQGIVWTTDFGDEIGRSLYKSGGYETAEIVALLAYLHDRTASAFPVVIDVGANIGTTSIPLAQVGYRVVAVEPVPDTFAMLHVNVERNGFADQITCVPKAISVGRDTVTMWVTHGSGQSEVAASDSRTPAFTAIGYAANRKIDVGAISLEKLLREQRIDAADVAFVWSDTQGSDADVLESGASLWEAGVPLYTEVTPRALELHHPVDHFVKLATASFSRFVTRDELVARKALAEPRPIGEFGRFVDQVGDGYSDVLLLA